MGNAYPCKSKKPHPSVKKQRVNQTILNRIFHIAKKKHHLSPAVKTERNMDKYREKMHVDDMDVVRLEVHMTSHIKGLIDYLESNHNKLADTGKYVSKTVIKSSNPETHILGLLVLRDLLNNIEKFCYNQDLLSRLVGGQGLENVTLTIEERRKIFQVPDPNEEGALDNSPDIVGFKSDMMGNIMEFEGSVMEVLSFTCDRKRNPLYDSSFKYSLQVFNLYTKKHLGVIPSERIEHILKEMMEIMHAYSNVDDQESLERNYQLIEIMTNLTKMPNIVLQFKHKFTQYSCSILRDLYLDDKKRSSEATGLNGSNSPTEMNTLKKETKQKVFGLIELVVQSLSDLTEFDVLMTPIFAFFDETEWTEEQLQKDVFSSLQNSMKDNTSFEQIEIFLMEKIIEYIDYDKIETQVPIGRYKNYKNPQVKAKVFAVLEVVLEESKKSFLSFLVADRMMICFMEILGELNISNSQCAHLKQSIYNCQRSFINKINNSAKSLTQVINCITAQIHKKAQGNHFDLGQIMEQIEFLNFTLDTTQSFPSKAPVPKDSIIMLLKLRDSQRMLFSTFLPIEKLLGLTYEIEGSEERVDSRGSALIPCEGEVGNALVSNNLTILQNLIKERRTLTDPQSQKDMKLLDFLLHYSRVNKSLLNRKEPILLKVETFSIKRIMDLIQTEIQIYQQKKDEQAKQNTSLLIYFLYDLIRTIADVFEIYSLGSQVERLTQRVPIDAFRLLEDNKQNLTRKTSDSIFECLRNSNLILSPWSEAERDAFLEILVSELKPYLPLLTIDKLKREIPDKDAYEDYSYNMNFLDDETASFQPPEFKSLPSMRADSLIRRESLNIENLKMTLPPKRKESMNIFNQVTSFEVPQKHIATTKITETIPEKDYSDSSVIDASFRKQLTDAHREKEKELNLSRILNDEIY